MTRFRTLAYAIIAVAVAPASAAAQQPAAQQPDRIGHIVAFVGDSAILNFDVQNAILAREATLGRRLPESGPERERVVEEVLEERINELLLVQAAARDTTIVVAEDQIARVVQAEIDERQRALGGAAELEQALSQSGMTLAAFRDMLTQQQRRRIMIEQFMQRKMAGRKSPPVSDQEMRAAFDARRGQFERRPPTVTFQQVLVRTDPSPEALARVRARADSVFERVRAREDFEQLARRHSEDGTRDRGGDLGFFRRHEMVREFANVAFALRPGEVSAPVLTQFGYHIIKVERVRGAEVSARHILFRHELTPADAQRARARADTVADHMRAGADVAELARRYGDRDEQVRIGPYPIADANRLLSMDLSDATPGQVIGPVPVGGDDIATQFVVVRVLERDPERDWTLDDPMLRDNLRQTLERQKLFDEIMQELRRFSYVEVRSR
ncbi:MAG TPA: peptidylprolyl isomerase [Longimicrobiales bacterium]|nr:peptidylprolyl isomerase [Longimicrobiales bacterium]